MKLLCDHMLGTLAKWLRIMGYDTAYPGALSDSEILRLADVEDRVLLTRDKELASRRTGIVRVRSDDLNEQIREVASALRLRIVDPLSRCSVCNAVLVPAPESSVEDRVPEGVRNRHHEFWRCPSCGRVYWQGTHWNKMVERLNDLHLLGKAPSRGPGGLRSGPTGDGEAGDDEDDPGDEKNLRHEHVVEEPRDGPEDQAEDPDRDAGAAVEEEVRHGLPERTRGP